MDKVKNGEKCVYYSDGTTESGKTHLMLGTATQLGLIPKTMNRLQEIYPDETINVFGCQLHFLFLVK